MAAEQTGPDAEALSSDGGFRIEFAVPADPAAVREARRIARDMFTAWGLDLEARTVDSAVVILAELVTNVVRHARVLCSQADVALTLADGVLGVSVHDRHPYRPRALTSPHPDDSGGWGLQLVRGLAAEAGGRTDVPADPDGNGKTVRVHLPLTANSRI